MNAPPENAKAARQGGSALNDVTEPPPSHSNKKGAKKINLWMPIWIGDYLADTLHLTCQQHGAYFLLLLAYWRNQGPLRDEPDELRRICRLTPRQFKKDWPRIAPFFESINGTIVHPRSDREIASWRTKNENFKKRGLKGSTERWYPKRDASSMGQALLDSCPSPSPPSLPKTSLSEPTKGSEKESDPWSATMGRLCSEYGLQGDEMEKLRAQHAKRLSKLTSGAYQTPENFTRALPSLLASVKGSAPKPATTDLMQQKEQHRSRWWTQWRTDSGGASDSWDTASAEDRLTFASSKYGDYFRAEAERNERVRIDESGGISIAPQ